MKKVLLPPPPLNIEKFSFAYISCFIRPICMEIERISNSADYFICLFALMKSYSNICVNYDYKLGVINSYLYNPDNAADIELINYILNKYFNCELSDVDMRNKNISDVVEKAINYNRSVFIPVNPSNIFYSEYYKEKDWIHWLYCHGYDRNKNLLYVQDHMQFGMANTEYRGFAIDIDLVNSSFNHFNTTYIDAPSRFHTFNLVTSNAENRILKDDKDFLQLLKTLCEKILNTGFEIKHIEEIAFNEKDFDVIFTFKHLKTIYNTIIHEVLYRYIKATDLKSLYQQGELIKQKWDEVAKQSKLMFLRKKTINETIFIDQVSEIKSLEKNYIKALLDCINSIRSED